MRRERKEESAVGKGGNGTGDENRNGATRRVRLTSENFCCHRSPPHWGGLLYCTSPVQEAIYFNSNNVNYYENQVFLQVCDRCICLCWLRSGFIKDHTRVSAFHDLKNFAFLCFSVMSD